MHILYFRSSEFSNLNQMESENKKISIGQFFNMRSNRVSSLIGSAVDDGMRCCILPKSMIFD